MRSPHLLGTTWRHRTSGATAVVWRLSSRIYLIDIDSIPPDVDLESWDGISDEDPKYWVFTSQREMIREWQRVGRGRGSSSR